MAADREQTFAVHPSPPFNPQPKPYRCPVCGGRGMLPHDFYNQIGYATSTERVQCRSCGGRGIVFS